LVLTFAAVTACFFGAIYFLATPISGQEIGANAGTAWDLKILALYSACMILAIALVAWLVVRKIFAPIVSLNDQLSAIDPTNLQSRVQIRSDDSELPELQEHISGLLSQN
jgi:hypothetical protein